MTHIDAPDAPDIPQPLRVRRRRRSRSKVVRTVGKFRRRALRAVRWQIALLAVTLGAAVVVVAGLILVTDASNRVESSLRSLNRVVDTVSSRPGTELTLMDFERLQSAVNGLRRDISIARRQLGFLSVFAFLDNDLEVRLDALDAAQELALAADNMLTGVQPTIFFLVSGDEGGTVAAQISSGERIVELLRIGRGRFVNAEQRLENAQMQVDQLDFASISPELLLQVESLSRVQRELRDINNLLLDAPDLLTAALGLGGDQSYVILAQNSDELRPSGGYISTFGWMNVRNGRITEYDYRPTTTTTPNPPPAERVSELDIPDWWIQYQQPIYAAWDGSWYADFPETAALAMWFYNNGNNPLAPVDGVIAIDIIGFEYLLEALGSVTVPTFNVVVTPENFRDVVYDIRAFGEGELAHKRFVADVYRQIFSDWQTIDRDERQSTDVLGATLRALQEKHILLHFTDEGLNDAVRLLGWSGAQEAATDHDYLMVADANLGNKSSRSVIRQLTYDVEIQPDGSLASRASIAYDFPARLADSDPAVDPEFHGPLDYNVLMQVFTPADSVLAQENNLQTAVTRAASDTHTAFVSRAQIAYDNGERFQFLYSTPPLVETFGPYHRYRLLLQKQAGMRAEPVNVQVTLPAEADIVSTSPQAVATYQLDRPIVEFRVNLITDQWIEVIYQ